MILGNMLIDPFELIMTRKGGLVTRGDKYLKSLKQCHKKKYYNVGGSVPYPNVLSCILIS